MKNFLKYPLLSLASALACLGYAGSIEQVPKKLNGFFYGSLGAGIMQANFQDTLNQQNVVFPANISATVDQQAFYGAFSFGYLAAVNQDWQLGAEFTGAGATGLAYLQDSSTQISDSIKARAILDLDFVAGLNLSQKITGYLKIGPSALHVKDAVASPAGFSAVYTTTYSNKWLYGIDVGLEAKRDLTSSYYAFVAYDYHYFPSIYLSNFENFASSYSHSIRVSSNTFAIGVGKNF